MNWSGLARQPSVPLSEDDPFPPDDRVIRSDGRTFDRLFRDQRGRLLRFFAKRTGPNDVDDLVQEAFARFVGRHGLRDQAVATPEAYLTTVATNLLRDRAKQAVARATAHHHLFDETEIAGPDPVVRLEARDALRRLEAAVARLRPRTRTVFLLQRVEGLTYPQIAERTGMSVKAVKKQMAKALFALRHELAVR